MARYRLSTCSAWKRWGSYANVIVWLREDSYGVWVSAVEGFRGGESKCSGPGAKKRALEASFLRIDDMQNVE